MPLYDFKCSACGFQFEQALKIANRLNPCQEPCEKCGGEIKLIITAAPTRLPEKGKVPEDWKQWTNKLKKANPGSDFSTW